MVTCKRNVREYCHNTCSFEAILMHFKACGRSLLKNWLLKLILTEKLFKIASKLTSIVTILANIALAGEHIFQVLAQYSWVLPQYLRVLSQYLRILSRWIHPWSRGSWRVELGLELTKGAYSLPYGERIQVKPGTNNSCFFNFRLLKLRDIPYSEKGHSSNASSDKDLPPITDHLPYFYYPHFEKGASIYLQPLLLVNPRRRSHLKCLQIIRSTAANWQNNKRAGLF